jgi:hypothetical protein
MVALVWGEPSFSCSWCGLYPIGRWLSFCVWGARIPPEKKPTPLSLLAGGTEPVRGSPRFARGTLTSAILTSPHPLE